MNLFGRVKYEISKTIFIISAVYKYFFRNHIVDMEDVDEFVNKRKPKRKEVDVVNQLRRN